MTLIQGWLLVTRNKRLEARARDAVVRIREVKDQTFQRIKNLKRNLSKVNWENEEVENRYSKSQYQCVLEQTFVEDKNKENLETLLETEHRIVDELRTISDNSTRMLWETGMSETYYQNLLRDWSLGWECQQRVLGQ